MDDSDDYFTDDIIFDEQTLAILDEEEQKFIRGLPHNNGSVSAASPPAKRQRTAVGWQYGAVPGRSKEPEETEDLPEISVRDDGSYDLDRGRSQIISGRTGNANTLALQSAPKSSRPSAALTTSAPPQAFPSSRPRHSPARNPHNPPQQNRLRTSSVAPPSRPVPVARTSPAAKVVKHPREADAKSDQAVLSSVMRQVEELRMQNEKIQATLKEALDIRYAKEGEVSILRKGIEKTAQDHAAQIAKLRAAKEEADAKQLQIQRNAKDEMERLKTQFTFKQHELETSVRKSPWSVRSKPSRMEPPPSPLPLPSQIRAWNDSRPAGGSSNFIAETPRRPRFGDIITDSPKLSRATKHTRGEESNLPSGFQTSPKRLSQSRNAPALQHMDIDPGYSSQNPLEQNIFAAPPQPAGNGLPLPAPQHSLFHGAPLADQSREGDILFGENTVEIINENHEGETDVVMEYAADMEPSVSTVPSEGVEDGSYDRITELRRIILTHTLPPSKLTTIQMLMREPLPSSLSSLLVDTYSVSSSQILEMLTISPSLSSDWDVVAQTTARALIDMVNVLLAAGSASALAGLYSLLTLLVYILPSFCLILLSILDSDSNEADNAPPQLLVLLCKCIQIHTSSMKNIAQSEDDVCKSSLARETIGLLEAISWMVPTELEGCLIIIPQTPGIMTALSEPTHPPWFLRRSTQLLVWLSTRPSIFRFLLVFSESDAQAEGEVPANASKVLHMEMLCSYLVDAEQHDPEAEMAKINILAFIAMLSVSHADGPTLLSESQTLIPSLVSYSTHLATPLWEGDEQQINSSSLPNVIRSIGQAVLLLHYLVFRAESTVNLRYKLLVAPRRAFNGINHMFVVTFGRLSYADPPEWIAPKERNELSQIADLARDLLDLVVEGPENDSIWETYQGSPERVSEVDDEEAEARKMDVTDDS